MSGQAHVPDFWALARRFTLPAIAVCLLHAGVWSIIVLVLTTPIMSGITTSVNWFLDTFNRGNGRIMETALMIKLTLGQAVQSLIAIFFGILGGAWVVRRQKRKAPAKNEGFDS